MQDAFNGPLKVLGSLLFEHIKASSKTPRRESIHLEEFMEVSSDVLSLLTNAQQLNYYFDVFRNNGSHMTVESEYMSVCHVPYCQVECCNINRLKEEMMKFPVVLKNVLCVYNIRFCNNLICRLLMRAYYLFIFSIFIPGWFLFGRMEAMRCQC